MSSEGKVALRRAVWVLAIVVLVALGWAIREQVVKGRLAADPCRYAPVGELTTRYPELGNLQDRHDLQSSVLQAEHDRQSAILEYRIKQGTISDERIAELLEAQGKRLDALIARQDEEFDQLCRRLVGR